MVGKNFSANNLGQRKASDFYETPYSITRQLLEVENFRQPILEPACGKGAIVKVLSEKYPTVGKDLPDDFRNETTKYPSVVTNPPFSLAYEFILKAKEIAQDKIAMLLPLSYLHGEERLHGLWNDMVFPLARVHVFSRYPMLGDPLREDGKYRTGMIVYAWYVWDRFFFGHPQIHWISNQKYILSKKDA